MSPSKIKRYKCRCRKVSGFVAISGMMLDTRSWGSLGGMGALLLHPVSINETLLLFLVPDEDPFCKFPD